MSRPFILGSLVLALDHDHPREWRPAWLMKHAPYYRGKTDGFEVTWAFGRETQAGGVVPSQGGWKPVRCLRHLTEGVEDDAA